MINEVIDSTKDQMESIRKSLQLEFSNVRTGRASVAVFDRVMVDAYGAQMPLNQTAGIRVLDSQTIAIEPWDKGLLAAIEKAIQGSDLGINPNNDGQVIRVTFPSLTGERRRELTKLCKTYAEEGRVHARNVRRDANQKIEKMSKDISEDDIRRGEAEIQKITDTAIKLIDDNLKSKEAEVMEV
ncbi:MAG: ribosome recycling factor [Coriobacteriia bacterium]|nr:ribosome recycling factor [Coriobacteriia bacterium]